MVAPIPLEEVFSPRGKPAFVGSPAFANKGEVPKGLERITRLIINMGTDCYLETLEVELSTLQGVAGWAALHIGKGQVLLWSSDDMNGAFCLFTLPSCWRPLMTFTKPVPWKAPGIDKPGLTYLAVCVMPMGWHRRRHFSSTYTAGRASQGPFRTVTS